MAFDLPALPYANDALEPTIDAKTMEIHHDKHHGGYTKKLNAAIEGTEWANKGIEQILTNLDRVPENIRTKVRNNGGGFYNHALFWKMMAPKGKGGEHSRELDQAIQRDFGGVSQLQEAFNEAAAGRFGSGWAWLIVSEGGKLAITSTKNQDSPIMRGLADFEGAHGTPILGLDVWEHAYYLNYQNRRPDYISAWWNVVNHAQVSENFAAATR